MIVKTTQKPITTTSASFRCTPNSTDPRCSQQVTTRAPPKCSPNSRDPRCRNIIKQTTVDYPVATTKIPSSRCSQYSRDPSCPRPSQTILPTRESATYLPPTENLVTSEAPLNCSRGSRGKYI